MNRGHSQELAQDLAEARKKKKKSRESPKTSPGSVPHQPPPPPSPAGPLGASGAPRAFGSSQVPPPPPPPSSTNQESQSKGSAAPSSSKIVASAEYQAWMMTDIKLRPSISLTPANLQIDEDMALDEQTQSSDEEDIRSAHIPKNNWASALASNYSPPPEDSLLAQTDNIATFIDCVDDSILRHNVSKPLPLGGPPGQLTIQTDFFFNKYLEYLRYGSKGSRPALSISKMKAAYYPDAGLEQMVPDQFWIEEECKYDISAMYGISHWWFQRQRFYIDRHTSEGDHSAVRTHMQILSVVRIEVFSMYGYNYMKKIVLRIESYQTQLNLTKPRWDATGFEYKHDYIVVDSPRAVTFWDEYGVQMMMRFNEIHKFSDGTLQQIDEALDYRVNEFRINRMNPGLNTRFWTKKDVDRSKAFMFAIQKRLKTMRIFRNLESFVGGRIVSWTEWRISSTPIATQVDIEKVAVCSSLRSLKSKRTIESRAKRSSKIISLGYYSITLASSHTVKSKSDIKSPTHYPYGIARTPVIPNELTNAFGKPFESLQPKDKENHGDNEWTFDELSAMAFEQRSSKPELQSMTSGHISLGLDLSYASSTITTQQLTKRKLDLLFKALYDDYIGGQLSVTTRTSLAAQVPQVLQTLTASTTLVDTTPTLTNPSSQAANIPNTSQDVDELKT
nr:hypothetical protein [Tanacetum cinerariifolium]